MSRTALLGYTGFVGSTLRRSKTYDALYNSSNIDEIAGQDFDHMVIAAVPAEKWKANQNPEADWNNIAQLIDKLRKVTARDVVLISTVDIYPKPVGVDENSEINPDNCHAYGRHRLMFENAVQELFPTRTLRLPGLFGHGLKKNVIFDYLNNNQIEKIETRASFQFYNMARLSGDIDRLLTDPDMTVNMAVQPVTVAEVAKVCGHPEHVNHVSENPAQYDVRSRYAEAGYFYNSDECLADLKTYVEGLHANA